jgi:small-conductance mechanosensitive channel
MSSVFAESWFLPAVIAVIGVPLLLVVLTELRGSLERAGRPGVRIVTLLRNVIVPLGGLLLLLSQTANVNSPEFTWTRVVATIFGFVVIVVLLSGLNLAFFVTAKRGTWRNRLPSIFVDLARAILIILCLALLFSWVWGADIGGLFTALGIGSIVIGLALQNAVGSVISGLLLLFEQPFELGDYLRDATGKGKIVEVNWRAVHLDTANGIRVIPNSELAGSSFVNLSRASSPYEASMRVRFATDDPPQAVIDVLVATAMDLPRRHPDVAPYAVSMAKAWYEINIPLQTPAAEYSTLGAFRTRLWYAARRADLHLDRDLTDNFRTPQRLRDALHAVAPALYLNADDAEKLAESVRLERFGEGEVVMRATAVPDGMRYILTGNATLDIAIDGTAVPIDVLGPKDFVGLTSLTRQVAGMNCTATTDVAVLFVPVAVLDTIVKTRPGLARDIGIEVDNRRERALAALKGEGYHDEPDDLMLG